MYIDNLLINASQFLNALFGGSPDGMLCSRLWRLHSEGIGLASVAVKIIDTIFFWDENHYKETYEYQLSRDTQCIKR